MSQVKLVVLEGENLDHRSLGVFDLEDIPKIGECIFFEKDTDEDPRWHTVKMVIHNIEPKKPMELWMVTLDDEQYYEDINR